MSEPVMFNKMPMVRVKGHEDSCVEGWTGIGSVLKETLAAGAEKKQVLVVECYQGVYLDKLERRFRELFPEAFFLHTQSLFRKEEEVRALTWPDVTDDRVFGYMSRLEMGDLMDRKAMDRARRQWEDASEGLMLIFGYGASLVFEKADLLVYADMARWEIQQRMRRKEVDNLGIRNREEAFELQYKRGFFVDWRICDRIKKSGMEDWDFLLDSKQMDRPALVQGEALREGLRQTARQPFSVVPFFDPGPWGGQWMKERFGLDPDAENYAWCFNGVPEEESLVLNFGECLVEIPSINVVFYQGRNLLGDGVHGLFGDEFPIRFDFLDTMEGGNLSLQVHPLTSYIQEKFGMHYTQDESYYLLDAGEGASVYLGLREDIEPAQMEAELRKAEREELPFEASRFVENWPARKHDHFLIPAGTVHCSGKNSMVLEISATPYIFTFKLYDWGRLNLDGRPRPINVDHGLKNIQWDRVASWTRENLVNRVEKVAEGEGWKEERTGLHEREFIETRRHWFTGRVPHHTGGGVNVLNLVEGEEIIVESPTSAFDPFVVHYAETFIVPAAVGEYTIRPHGPSFGKECATVKAFIRIQP